MDYKNDLVNNILSETNIQYIVELILQNFTIGPSAITKCKKIIKRDINNKLNSLTRYPQSSNELIEIIGIINKSCYDDFALYLINKYPARNIHRRTDSEQYVNQTKSNTSGMVIITEAEKNALLKQYNVVPSVPKPKNELSMDTFLEYLTNPHVLQMFQMMLNQVNQINHNHTTNTKPVIPTNVSSILSEDDVRRILKNVPETKKSKKLKKPKKSDPKPTIKSKNITVTKSESETETASAESHSEELSKSSESSEESIDSIDSLEDADIKTENSMTDLLKIEKRIKEIVELKNKYANQSNKKNLDKVISDLDTEKKQLILSMYELKRNNDKIVKENKTKITKLQDMYSIRTDAKDNNIGYLDLQIDPTENYADLKNIIIKFTSDQKISDISLIDYFLPFNGNNVTRFNGEFAIFLGERTYRIIVPPAHYTILTLIKYITSQITFLEFSIDESMVITIKNTIDTKFDLMAGENTIFPLLGFTSKSNSYKNRLSFTASAKYDLDSNKKVFFVLSGTSMEPIELEFDKKVTQETSLRRSSSKAGFSMKQIILRFNNNIDQCYDFIMPLNMCLRITYVKPD